MMRKVILIRPYFSHLLYYLDPVSPFKYFWYNIKQKCKFKSSLLGVLCAIFGHFLSRHGYSIAPGELFLRGSYLKPERSRNISRKMFSLVPGDVLCDPDEVFEVFVDIDSDLSLSKDAYSALGNQSL